MSKTPESDDRARALGQRVAAARKRVGTQKEVAAALGISEVHLRRIETGVGGSPSLDLIVRIATVCKVTVAQLAGEEAGAPKIDRELLGRIQQAIARVYREEGVALDELELGRIGADELNAVGDVSPDEWHVVARVIAEQHRHRLRTESMASRRAVSGSYKDGA